MALKIFGPKSPKELYNSELKRWGGNTNQKINQYFHDSYTKQTLQIGIRPNEMKMGEIYTYNYDPKYKDILDYYDTNPLTLIYNSWYAPGTKNHLYTGINLHFLPSKVKLSILEAYWQYFYNLKGNRVMRFLPISYNAFFDVVFRRILGVNYSFAIRNYIITRIDNPVMVPDYEWGKIPFTTGIFMQGATLEEIYKLYYKSKKKK